MATLASRPGGARFMAKIPKEDERILVMKDQMERAILEALGVGSKQALPVDMQILVDQIIDGLEPMTALFTRGNAPKGSNIVAVLHNGKPSYYEVIDPLLYRSLVALNRPHARRLDQVAGHAEAGWAARGDPDLRFHRPQPVPRHADGRDHVAARLQALRRQRPWVPRPGSCVTRTIGNSSPTAAASARICWTRPHTANTWNASSRARGSTTEPCSDAPDKLWFAVNRIAEAFEQSTRLGEFRQAIARGEHPRHAAYSAREVGTGLRHARR